MTFPTDAATITRRKSFGICGPAIVVPSYFLGFIFKASWLRGTRYTCCGRESIFLDDRGVGVQPECPNHGTHDEQTRCHDEWCRPRAELGQNAEDQRGESAADVSRHVHHP